MKGFALIATTIILSALISISILFISFSTADVRIARAHAATTQAYYLGEAATSILINKIRTNTTLKTAFVNGTLNEANSKINLSNVLQTNDSVSVYAASTSSGNAEITVKSDSPLGTASATRTTKTDISRALGDALVDYAMLSSGSDPYMMLRMDTKFNGGILFGGKYIDVYDNSIITMTNGSAWAHYRIIMKSSGSRLIVTGGTTREYVPSLQLPAVDFDSADPQSWKNQATRKMTASEFDRLPNGSTLEGTIFVEGSHYLRQNLTVHGLLIINGNFEVEQGGYLTITANSGPSGLLVKQTIELETHASIEGLVYAGKTFEIEYDDDDTPPGVLYVSINGGILAGSIKVTHDIPGPVDITITHNPDLIGRVMNASFNNDSPTIDVGHWEEEY